MTWSSLLKSTRQKTATNSSTTTELVQTDRQNYMFLDLQPLTKHNVLMSSNAVDIELYNMLRGVERDDE